MNIEPAYACLCIITWPDGTTGLLFPRRGNVPIAEHEFEGQRDFEKCQTDLADYIKATAEACPGLDLNGTKIRLIKFQALEVLAEHVHGA